MTLRAIFESHGRRSLAAPADSRAHPESPASAPIESQEVRAMRRRLLILAESEGVPAALVHRLGVADVAGCLGLRDWELSAYLSALERIERMHAGYVPRGWNRAGMCSGCGPVYLPADHPLQASACPWCPITRAGGDFIRPPVRCGECRHFIPSRFNPESGMGACALGKVRRFAPLPYPHAGRLCRFWRAGEGADALGGARGGDGRREPGRAAGGVCGSLLALPPAGNSDPDSRAHNGIAVQLTGGGTE